MKDAVRLLILAEQYPGTYNLVYLIDVWNQAPSASQLNIKSSSFLASLNAFQVTSKSSLIPSLKVSNLTVTMV